MRAPMLVLLALGGLLVLGLAAAPRSGSAQARSDGRDTADTWKVHDLNRPQPPVVTPAPAGPPIAPPGDAIVLFDGTSLDGWQAVGGEPASWRIDDGALVVAPGTGDIQTREAFGDVQLHVEWAAPNPPAMDGQNRGNSGLILMGRYEVQVLDSYGNRTYPDGQAAAVYGQHPPLANAMRPPGEWQTYDVIFRRPRFNRAGALVTPARVTVLHNGILVQDDVAFKGPTMWLQNLPYTPHAERLPLVLQDHGQPVRFRNIWVRDLEARPPLTGTPTYPEDTEAITLALDELKRYTGRYEVGPGNAYTITLEGDQLHVHFFGPQTLPLIPLSEERFVLKHTAGELVFDLNDQGSPDGFTFYMGGAEIPATRISGPSPSPNQ